MISQAAGTNFIPKFKIKWGKLQGRELIAKIIEEAFGLISLWTQKLSFICSVMKTMKIKFHLFCLRLALLSVDWLRVTS